MSKYIKFLGQYLKDEKGKIAPIFIFIVLSQSLSLTEPYFFAQIVDNFLRQFQNLQLFPTEPVFFQKLTLFVLGWIAVAFGARIYQLQTQRREAAAGLGESV